MNIRMLPTALQVVIAVAIMTSVFVALSLAVPGWEGLWKYGIAVAFAYAAFDQLYVRRRRPNGR